MAWMTPKRVAATYNYTEYTQKNGEVYYVFSMETAPFFCVYPVLFHTIIAVHFYESN
jgi:hypothetical protein